MEPSTKAIDVLGKDFTFPNSLEGLPATLSAFNDLHIKTIKTNDGVVLRYWKAGEGTPLLFIPGWSAHGAMYINLMCLLRKDFKVYVLDQRNHGLSDKVAYGNRISRLAMDVQELCDHLDLKSAFMCGWSMGCSVLWAYIDLFGTSSIRKVAFIDEVPSIYNHTTWSEEERNNAGSFTTAPERMEAIFAGELPPNRGYTNTDVIFFFDPKATPYFENSEAFANAFVEPDMSSLRLVLFDHITNDWRDVIQSKIDIPTAIFSGEYSDWVTSQKWMQSVIPNSQLFVYSKADHGDHFLHLKNPVQFVEDLRTFLQEGCEPKLEGLHLSDKGGRVSSG